MDGLTELQWFLITFLALLQMVLVLTMASGVVLVPLALGIRHLARRGTA